MLISDMGVPQGTILGPSSFSCYLNDMSLKILIALLILFADDSTAVVKGKTVDIVNKKSSEVNYQFVKFAAENFLKINASKTKALQIHTHQTLNLAPPELKIDDVSVEIVTNSKLLGIIIIIIILYCICIASSHVISPITISDTMNWSLQCNRVASKLRSVYNVARKCYRRNIKNCILFLCPKPNPLLNCDMGRIATHGKCIHCPKESSTCYGGDQITAEQLCARIMPTPFPEIQNYDCILTLFL